MNVHYSLAKRSRRLNGRGHGQSAALMENGREPGDICETGVFKAVFLSIGRARETSKHAGHSPEGIRVLISIYAVLRFADICL